MMATFATPSFFPTIHHEFNQYLVFDLNWSCVVFVVGFLGYFFILLPSAAVCPVYTCRRFRDLKSFSLSLQTDNLRPDHDTLQSYINCIHRQ